MASIDGSRQLTLHVHGILLAAALCAVPARQGCAQAVSETPGGARLTDREIDCLSLTAIGKTLEEAAIILTLSSSTVRFHLRNACRKLGAANRMQAVSKAAYLGLLGSIY